MQKCSQTNKQDNKALETRPFALLPFDGVLFTYESLFLSLCACVCVCVCVGVARLLANKQQL